MDRLTSQILIDIIKHEMSLSAQAVWIRDQNKLIPNDNGLYVVVGMTSAIPYSNVVSMVTETNAAGDEEQHQICEVQMTENIMIDIFSRSNDALTRNWEIVAALQSYYAQQMQELHNFKISRIPRNFLNASSAEGGSNINRYSATVACMVWYRKDTLLNSPLGDYYDDFTTRVDDEATIGTVTPLIEFEITPDSPPPP